MSEIVVKIIVEMFSTIALATIELKEGRSSVSVLLPTYYLIEHIAVNFVKVFTEKNVDAVLQRLGRLTQDEVQTTAAQILEDLHKLVENLTVVMNSEPKRPYTHRLSNIIRSRWRGIRSRCTGTSRYVPLARS